MKRDQFTIQRQLGILSQWRIQNKHSFFFVIPRLKLGIIIWLQGFGNDNVLSTMSNEGIKFHTKNQRNGFWFIPILVWVIKQNNEIKSEPIDFIS